MITGIVKDHELSNYISNFIIRHLTALSIAQMPLYEFLHLSTNNTNILKRAGYKYCQNVIAHFIMRAIIL